MPVNDSIWEDGEWQVVVFTALNVDSPTGLSLFLTIWIVTTNNSNTNKETVLKILA
jgi:hypothetical protein